MDLPRMAEGGLDAQIFACWINPDYPEGEYIQRTLRMIDGIHETARAHPDRIEVALTGADVGRIVGSGRVAAVIGIEGGHAIVDDIRVLRQYHRLGVRCMTLTWNNTNNWADSANDTTRWNGLNDLGLAVVDEMDRLGMVIDLSHVSDSTFFDVLERTAHPVLVSHSCMRALCDIPRNISDDMLRTLAGNGGVVCVNFFAGFLDKDYFERVSTLWDEMRARRKKLTALYGGDMEKAWETLWPEYRERIDGIPLPDVARLVDHIDHAVGIVGVDHVGLGSDFDGISATPAGIDDVSDLPVITAELLRRGYAEDDVRKILGGNLLRLFGEVCR